MESANFFLNRKLLQIRNTLFLRYYHYVKIKRDSSPVRTVNKLGCKTVKLSVSKLFI